MKIMRRHVVLGILAIFIIWASSGFLISFFSGGDSRGTFGDMFGAINSLFSGLALFGIIVSILIQQSELNLQRQELKETRKEFLVNRITNIILKKTDRLNDKLNDFKLDAGHERLARDGRMSIDDFVELLMSIESADELRQNDRILHYLTRNKLVIDRIMNEIILTFESLDRIIKQPKLDRIATQQLMFLTHSGLGRNLRLLLNEYKKYMKKPKLSGNEEVDLLNQSNFEYLRSKLNYILNFDFN